MMTHEPLETSKTVKNRENRVNKKNRDKKNFNSTIFLFEKLDFERRRQRSVSYKERFKMVVEVIAIRVLTLLLDL